MAVDQLPGRVREFVDYLDGLLARLDQGGGWCGVFWQRDPDGMQACLDGREMPPWDVMEALLQDLAAGYGPAVAGVEAERARALHAAALLAYDARPGGREALGDRFDVMLREQRYAAERQAELGRLLASAATREEADALRLDLAWARDDHERATRRCAELRSRLEQLDRRADTVQPIGRGPVGAAHRVDDAPQGSRPDSSYGTGFPDMPQQRDTDAGPRAGAVTAAWRERERAAQGGTDVFRDQRGAGGAGTDMFRDARRADVRDTGAPDGYGAPADGTPGAPDGPGADTDVFHDFRRGHPAGPAASGTAEPQEPQPAGAEAAAPPEPPSPQQQPAPKQRKRRRGSARFAGMAEAEAAPAVVPPEIVPDLPAPSADRGRGLTGARFAGAAAGPGEGEGERPRRVPLETADRREVGGTVETLARLRGEGRSGEAHALLAELAYWPPARFPLLAAELQRAGLGADWATLLWETASLPADRLVAAADALVAAGRTADGEQVLRQGVARPAPEIGEAVLALVGDGRRREARALLDAYVRVRTPEEAARSVAPDPQTLVPLLLEAAQGVSEERHWDLVHALRVAGFTA